MLFLEVLSDELFWIVLTLLTITGYIWISSRKEIKELRYTLRVLADNQEALSRSISEAVFNNIQADLVRIYLVNNTIVPSDAIARAADRYIKSYIRELSTSYKAIKSSKTAEQALDYLTSVDTIGATPVEIKDYLTFIAIEKGVPTVITFPERFINKLEELDNRYKNCVIESVKVNTRDLNIPSVKSVIIEHFRVFFTEFQKLYYEVLPDLLSRFEDVKALKHLLQEGKIGEVISRLDGIELNTELRKDLAILAGNYNIAKSRYDRNLINAEDMKSTTAKTISGLTRIVDESE